jgi:serine/threonine protein kinase/formylglycine-generating enzyme required for sulfatase activity
VSEPSWVKIREIAEQALDVDPKDRDAFVVTACGGDGELLAAVRAVLQDSSSGMRSLRPPSAIANDDEATPPPVGEIPTSLGGYELIRPLGHGGSATVYEARETALDRSVALKLLPFGSPQEQIDRFRREAVAVAKLEHPGIVRVHRVGHDAGRDYMVMDLVAGPDLASEIERVRLRREGGIAPQGDALLPAYDSPEFITTVCRIVAAAAAAIEHAHLNGIVHRDLKPSNLVLERASGRVIVVDFGIARDERFGQMTRTGQTPGTPAYMSPEQISARSTAVDHRTDVYSLGVVLYELLTLSRPHEAATTAELFDRIRSRDPMPVRTRNPRVARDIETICEKALEKRPGDRYPSAAALAADLRSFLRHESIAARPPSLLDRCVRRLRRHRVAVVAVGAAALLAFGGVEYGRRASSTERLAVRLAAFDALGQRAAAGIDSMSVDDRRALVEIVGALEATLDELPEDAVSRLSSARAEIDAWRARVKGECERALVEVDAPGGDPAAKEWKRGRALMTLQTLALLFPQDEEVERALRPERILPRVDIDAVDANGAALGATVHVRRIELEKGTPGTRVLAGRTPLRGFTLEPGYSRIVVEFDGGGHRELTRYFEAGSSSQKLLARRRSDEERIGDAMIAFAAGPFRVPPATHGTHLRGQIVELEAFAIDECEVSNGEYREFLAANPGVEVPDYFAGEQPANFDDLPVVGVTWFEAQAFAEWRGKRLATEMEWCRAVRGLEGRDTPWLPRPDGSLPPGANVAHPFLSPAEEPARRAEYLSRVVPVRSAPDARTPEGLHHAFGNVNEFTETIKVEYDFGMLAPFVWRRVLLGKDWSAVARNFGIDDHSHTGVGTRSASHTIGFRCARSLAP